MTTKTPSEVIAEFLEAVLLPQKQQKDLKFNGAVYDIEFELIKGNK